MYPNEQIIEFSFPKLRYKFSICKTPKI